MEDCNWYIDSRQTTQQDDKFVCRLFGDLHAAACRRRSRSRKGMHVFGLQLGSSLFLYSLYPMSYNDLAGPADLAIPFEVCALFHCFHLLLLTVPKPDPYSYDSTSSPYMQVMRKQEDKFFAFFPEAKKAAEYRKHRNKVYLATLHCAYGLGHRLVSAPLIHKSYQAAYHNSSSGYYLVQQPQDIVYEPINHVPPTPVSQSSLKAGKNLIILLQLTPPPPDIHDDLSEFTPAIPNFYQRRDSQLAHAIKFR